MTLIPLTQAISQSGLISVISEISGEVFVVWLIANC
jgi:hypothetical protein